MCRSVWFHLTQIPRKQSISERGWPFPGCRQLKSDWLKKKNCGVRGADIQEVGLVVEDAMMEQGKNNSADLI